MYKISSNSKFDKKSSLEISNKYKIDSGIHFNFNSMEKWAVYKINKSHLQIFIRKIFTITGNDEFHIIDIVKYYRSQKLTIKEYKIFGSGENELFLKLNIKTILEPEEYFHKVIKGIITSKPSIMCYNALFSINKKKYSI